MTIESIDHVEGKARGAQIAEENALTDEDNIVDGIGDERTESNDSQPPPLPHKKQNGIHPQHSIAEVVQNDPHAAQHLGRKERNNEEYGKQNAQGNVHPPAGKCPSPIVSLLIETQSKYQCERHKKYVCKGNGDIAEKRNAAQKIKRRIVHFLDR